MEIVLRTGKEKKYYQMYLKEVKRVESLQKEINEIKLRNGLLEIKLEKKERSINYYKKKVGVKNGKKNT